jgi:hypothetical protein
VLPESKAANLTVNWGTTSTKCESVVNWQLCGPPQLAIWGVFHFYSLFIIICTSRSLLWLHELCLLNQGNLQPVFTLKNAVFLDVAPCGFNISRRFGRTCRLHLQCRRKKKKRELGETLYGSYQTNSHTFSNRLTLLARVFSFCPEDGRNNFQRRVGLYEY